MLTKGEMKHEFQDALEEYKGNIEFTLNTSGCDETTYELHLEMAKQTFYALDHFAEIIVKAFDE